MSIDALSNLTDTSLKALFSKHTRDSSYFVSGTTLSALADADSPTAYIEAKSQLGSPAKSVLANSRLEVLLKYAKEEDFDLVSNYFATQSFRFRHGLSYANFLDRVKDVRNFTRGVDVLVSIRNDLPATFHPLINKQILEQLVTKKNTEGQNELADYIKTKL